MPDNPLQALMNPRSIATVGAGNNPLKMGAIQALSILKDGYGESFTLFILQRKKFSAFKPTARLQSCLNHPIWSCLCCRR
ncbi:MAG: hypothetical protein SVV67_06045 [Bacillota bacterium]|nr:hypothetical protein [Bacillota bacterium]